VLVDLDHRRQRPGRHHNRVPFFDHISAILPALSSCELTVLSTETYEVDASTRTRWRSRRPRAGAYCVCL